MTRLVQLEEDPILIDGVYENAGFIITRINMKNLSDKLINLNLSTSSTSNLKFQLDNENFQVFGKAALNLNRDVPVDKSQMLTRRHFNDVFNLVGYVNSIILKPNERKSLFLLYQASDAQERIENSGQRMSFRSFNETVKIFSWYSKNGYIIADRFDVNVKILSCTSYFSVILPSQGFDFNDCVLGSSYTKDFTIINDSEIRSCFQLAIDRRDIYDVAQISFIDTETGENIDSLTINGFSSRIVRMILRPLKQAYCDFTLRMENPNNDNNLHLFKVSFFSRVPPDETVQLSVAELDYGDCYVASPTSKTIKLSNMRDIPIDIHLSSDNPDVKFKLKTNDDIPQIETPKIIPFADSSVESLEITTPTSGMSTPTFPQDSDEDTTSVMSSEKLVDFNSPIENLLSANSNNENAEYTYLDDISIPRKSDRTFEVEYLPSKKELSSSDRGLLQKVTFRLHFTYSSQQWKSSAKNVVCKAKVCESLIEVTPARLDFEDVNVGTLKSLPIVIKNISDLPTVVQIKFTSKILNIYRGEMEIPPHQFIEVKLDIFPRKINADYRKQIHVLNLKNRDNDQSFEAVSNNVDRNRVTFHSLFYHMYTSTSTNFLDFGTVVVNNPTIRTLEIENISRSMLKIQLSSSSPDELQIYTFENEDYLTQDLTPKSVDDAVKDSFINFDQRGIDKSTAINNDAAAIYLDLALNAESSPKKLNSRQKKSGSTLPRSKTYMSIDNIEGNIIRNSQEFPVSKVPMEGNFETLKDLVSALEFNDLHARTILKRTPEEDFLSAHLFFKRKFFAAINDNKIFPISQLEIKSGEKKKVLVLFTASGKKRPYVIGKPKKNDAKIYFKLLDFDRNTKSTEFDQLLKEKTELIPVREMLVRSLLCRSNMEIGQKNINFGLVAKKERLSKTIVIYNRSEAPLHYALKKSGSIASGDIMFSGNRMGILRGFGKREVEFIFCPSLHGMYYEKLIIENLQDRDNDQTVNLKAQVRKPSNFFIKSLVINIGMLLLEESCFSTEHPVIVINTSKQLRHFEVGFDSKSLETDAIDVSIEFAINSEMNTDNSEYLSKETEDEIEHLEQKLKIATRKGQTGKVQKIKDKLIKLKRDGDVAALSKLSSPVTEFQTEEQDKDDKTQGGENNFSVVKRTPHSIVFSIEPGKSRTILAKIQLKVNRVFIEPFQKVRGNIYVHEHRNLDYMKIVEFLAQVFIRKEDFTIYSDEPNSPSMPHTPSLSRTTSNTSLRNLDESQQNSSLVEDDAYTVGL